jgi:ATP-binding cassette, subfamily B, bacterial PglK
LQNFSKLWQQARFVGAGAWRKVPLLALLMVLCTALDVVAIALIPPFISSLTGAQAPGLGLASVNAGNRAVWLLGLAFLAKAVAGLVLQGVISWHTESVRADVMTRLLAAYQRRPYRFHLQYSSSDLSARIMWYSQAFSSGVLAPAIRLLADALVLVAICALIANTSVPALLLLLLLLLPTFYLVLSAIRSASAINTQRNVEANSRALHAVQQALGSLREARIFGGEAHFLSRLKAAADGLLSSAARTSVVQLIPRQALELAMLVFVIALVGFSHASPERHAQLLPLLGMIAAAALRLVPASSAVLNNINLIRSNFFALELLANDLSGPNSSGPNSSGQVVLPTQMPAEQIAVATTAFQSLRVENLHFQYEPNTNPVIQALNVEILAGECVGMLGASGSGKSTLADLLLGFLQPSVGAVLLNGVDIQNQLAHWHARVAYIPQQPYLLDDSVRSNVALGQAQGIDDTRIWQALQDAHLAELVRAMPAGLDSHVGERGVRFSGGQRQRLAIARALYFNREFLLFDEATSALDAACESEIIATIKGLAGRKTIVLISHRESTLAATSRRIAL